MFVPNLLCLVNLGFNDDRSVNLISSGWGVERPLPQGFDPNIFQKVPKNCLFWPVFFPKFACGAENWVFIVIRESSENQFVPPEKKVDKFSKFFVKIPHLATFNHCFFLPPLKHE